MNFWYIKIWKFQQIPSDLFGVCCNCLGSSWFPQSFRTWRLMSSVYAAVTFAFSAFRWTAFSGSWSAFSTARSTAFSGSGSTSSWSSSWTTSATRSFASCSFFHFIISTIQLQKDTFVDGIFEILFDAYCIRHISRVFVDWQQIFLYLSKRWAFRISSLDSSLNGGSDFSRRLWIWRHLVSNLVWFLFNTKISQTMFEKFCFFQKFKIGKNESSQDNHYENCDKTLCSRKLLFYLSWLSTRN